MLCRYVLVGLLAALPLSAGSAGPVRAARVAGDVRSFMLTATQEIWLDNGYPGLRMDTTPVRIQTMVWYAAPTRWRIERRYLTPPPQPALVGVFRPEPSVSVRDGRTWWSYDAVHHTASRQTAPDVQDVYPSGPPLWFESRVLGEPIPTRAARSIAALLKAVAACDTAGMVPISTPRLVGRGTVAGRPADVIDFGPRPCGWNSASAPEFMGRRLMWVDRQTFFVLKVVRYSVFFRLVRPHDRYFERTTVTGLRYKVSLPAARFAFTPPPGTRRVSAAASPPTPAASSMVQASVSPLAEGCVPPLMTSTR
jgi:hypothetical protein